MSKFMLSDDATYKLLWFDYPVFVGGRSTSTKKFFQTHLSLSSHEDTSAWVRIFAYVKSVIGENPRLYLADGAREISNAGRSVWTQH